MEVNGYGPSHSQGVGSRIMQKLFTRDAPGGGPDFANLLENAMSLPKSSKANASVGAAPQAMGDLRAGSKDAQGELSGSKDAGQQSLQAVNAALGKAQGMAPDTSAGVETSLVASQLSGMGTQSILKLLMGGEDPEGLLAKPETSSGAPSIFG